MNRSLLPLAALVATSAHAEPILSNASADPAIPAIATSSVSASGIAAPAGFLFAETPGSTVDANAMAGFNIGADPGIPGPFRLADDFTIDAAYGVRLNTLTIYAYVPGHSSATQSPFASASVRLWMGHPADPSSWVIFGDETTNRLAAARPTQMLRIFNTRPLPLAQAPDSQRRIWAIDIDLGGHSYGQGAYWMDVQVNCTDPAKQAWAVPVSVAGTRGGAPSNAYALVPEGLASTWIPIFDPGKGFLSLPEPQDLAFTLEGEVIDSVCPADFNLDGGVDGDDVTAFFIAWEAGELSADVNFDGGTDGSDITAFFTVWEAGGC